MLNDIALRVHTSELPDITWDHTLIPAIRHRWTCPT